LKKGLIKQEAKNIKTRKFIAETSMEFLDWAEDNLRIGIKIEKNVIFENFISEYTDFKRWLSKKKFNIWCQKYANFINVEYTENSINKKSFILGEELETEETPF